MHESELKVTYFAGPYSGDVGKNRVTAEYWALGWVADHPTTIPVVPHLLPLAGRDYEETMTLCLELLSRCDAIVMMPRWHLSPGARREYEYAKENGMPVFFIDERTGE